MKAKMRSFTLSNSTSLFADFEAEPGNLEIPASEMEADTHVTYSNENFLQENPFELQNSIEENAVGPKAQAMANIAAIKLGKVLHTENRTATSNEKDILSKFSGWGSCKQIFEEDNHAWNKLYKELKTELSEDEYALARASIVNAFYTPQKVTQEMWKFFEKKGFKGGKILEPAMGNGRFLASQPQSLRAKTQWVGVELDTSTAKIAQGLHDDAYVYSSGFQDVSLPENSFEAVMTNVPFGNFAVNDPKYNSTREHIHNYFFKKSLALTKPNGIVMGLTSTGTLQARDAKSFREALHKEAELLAAIRLPGGTFSSTGTEVTCDLLIFRKRDIDEAPKENEAKWFETQKSEVISQEGKPLFLNEYFLEHPEHLLGSLSEDKLYPGRLALTADDRDVAWELRKILENIDYDFAKIPSQSEEQEKLLPREFQDIPNFSYFEHQGKVFFRVDTEISEANPAEETRIKSALQVAKSLEDLMDSELHNRSEETVMEKRLSLNKIYDKFAEEFGCFNSTANRKVMEDDPRFPLLLSLEESWDKRSNKAQKAEIFFERTIKPLTTTKANTPKDAMLLSLNECGEINFEYMEKLLGERKEQMVAALESENLIFQDPVIKKYVTSDEYLSGNVREKLRQAKDAGLSRNITALENEQPKWILPSCNAELRADLATKLGGECDLNEGFTCNLGVSWVEPEDIKKFLTELLEVSAREITVTYSKLNSSWTVETGGYSKYCNENNNIYGTGRKPAHELLEMALNLREPKVYDKVGDETVINEKETEFAKQKQAQLKEKFTHWIWHDEERCERLTRKYNELYNSEKLRDFNGQHLTLPGISPNIELRAHQKNAIWRAVQSQASLFAHCVGAGKTYALCASAMEMRRLKTANKPMLVVLPDTITDIEKSFRELYPSAKLLVPSEKDFQKENRQKLIARIATGNWDAVILTHPQFAKIKLSKEGEAEFIKEEIDKLEDCILSTSKRSGRLTKELEKAKLRLTSRIKDVISETKKDLTIDFEKLGVDAVLVDEAHVFKNLGYATKLQNVKGLPNSSSQRAFDMYMKTRWLHKNNGKIVFATGTPVMNSIAEFYTLQRYLQPKELVNKNLEHFDSWAATFGEVVTQAELAPTGKYREATRFSKIVNLPELQTMFRSVADVQTPEMLNLPRPKVDFSTVVATPSEEQLAFNDAIVERAESIRAGSVPPEKDNYLKLTSDGRKASLDIRLVQMNGTNVEYSKVNTCLGNVFSVWDKTRDSRAAQAVFCDFSTPKGKKKFDVYNYLKDGLVGLGVPAQEIAFIHDCQTKEDKKKLFAKVNSGKVRVVLGSTQKLGTGVNIQQRLLALHNLDAPYRPADLEQRGGRIQRQGNIHKHVAILNYVTEGKNNQAGFDAFLWQTLETKSKFIEQIMTGKSGVRTAEDIDSTEQLTFAQVKALASGDTRIIEKANVDSAVGKLSRLAKAHEDEQFRYRRAVLDAEDHLKKLPERITSLTTDVRLVNKNPMTGERFVVNIQGRSFKERSEAGKRVFELARYFKETRPAGEFPIGSFGPFELRLDTFGTGNLVLRGDKERFKIPLSESPLGSIISLGNAYEKTGERLAALKSDLEKAQKTVSSLKEKIGREFSQAAELKALRERQRELDKELGIWNDPTAARVTDENQKTSEEKANEEADEDDVFEFDDSGTAAYQPPEEEILAKIKLRTEEATPGWLQTLLERNTANEVNRITPEREEEKNPVPISQPDEPATPKEPEQISQSLFKNNEEPVKPNVIYQVNVWRELPKNNKKRTQKPNRIDPNQSTIFDFAKEQSL